MSSFIDDTIYALATPPGMAALAVVRISGPLAPSIVQTLTQSPLPEAGRLIHRKLFNTKNEILDDAMVIWRPAPHTSTGEAVCELHLHGGIAVLQAVLNELAKIEHVRLARPGEFTKRSWLNGRMNLTAAESVADLINAITERQRQQAIRQLSGVLGQTVEQWRQQCISLLSQIEGQIEFPDDVDQWIVTDPQLLAAIDRLHQQIALHVQRSRTAQRLRCGVRLAVIGAPNVGKSTLLNAICERDLAIVNPTPGTTRDIVETLLDWKGYPVIITDSAGIRETDDAIESEGIQRAYSTRDQADIALVVWDVSRPETWHTAQSLIAGLPPDAAALVIANKSDLVQPPPAQPLKIHGPSENASMIPISLLTKAGWEHFTQQLTQTLEQTAGLSETVLASSLRQRESLTAASEHLHRAKQLNEVELMAEELRMTSRRLGEVVGVIDVEETLDELFTHFCVGK